MPRYAYHAAHPRDRQSIRENGLLPGTWASQGEPGVYMYWPSVYAEGYRDDEPIDVWKVDTKGLAVFKDPEDPSIAIYVTEAIPASAVKLDITMLAGEVLEEEALTLWLEDNEDDL